MEGMMSWIVRVRNESRPIARATLFFLTTVAGLQLILTLVAHIPTGVGDMHEIYVGLAGLEMFSENGSCRLQAIVGVLLTAFVCSCDQDWGAWAFRRDGEKWSYPFEIRLTATAMNMFFLISVMHVIGLFVDFNAMGSIRVWLVLYAIVTLLYIFSTIGAHPMGASFLVRFAQEMLILLAFMMCWRGESVAGGVGSMLSAVVFCYVLNVSEPVLTERWNFTLHRAMSWLGISVEED